jgi:hypothetical protein
MNEAPKKVWISGMGGWFATESSCDIPYIRADIVDQLVEALEWISKVNTDNWEYQYVAQAALKALEESNE